MIDLHFHCLPAIDDGPRDWGESVALCRAAAQEGTKMIVATPHVLRSPWMNEDAPRRAALVAELNERLGGTPLVLPGCEYFFSADALELVERGESTPLTGLNEGSYLLLEFPSDEIPPNAPAIFHELSVLRITPVIAHPERSRHFAVFPEQLEELLERGARVQVTAGSLLGDFGVQALTACREFFRRGLVHLVASDAHSLARRPPRLAAARVRVREEWGAKIERELFETNPSAVLRSEPVSSRAAETSSGGRRAPREGAR